MAEIAATVTDLSNNMKQVVWAGLATGDTGDWQSFPGYERHSVHVYGTVGGSTVAIQGSNETVASPTAPATMTDEAGTALSFTVLPAIKGFNALAYQMRPVVTGGAGVSVTISMLLRVPGTRD